LCVCVCKREREREKERERERQKERERESVCVFGCGCVCVCVFVCVVVARGVSCVSRALSYDILLLTACAVHRHICKYKLSCVYTYTARNASWNPAGVEPVR